MIKDFAVVVFSCDKYIDVLNHFSPLLKRSWTDFQEKCYFIMENSQFSPDQIAEYSTIKTGYDMAWSDRVVFALKRIKEEYILFMLDDYYIGRQVLTSTVERIVSVMEKNAIEYYDLRNKARTKGKKFNSDSYFIKNVRYGRSLQAAIWKRTILLKLLENKSLSAWQVESMFNQMNSEFADRYIPSSLVDGRNILNIQNGVIQGKWNPEALKFFKKNGYLINPGNRGIVPKKYLIKMHIISTFYCILPNGLIVKIKRLLKKLGMRFITE